MCFIAVSALFAGDCGGHIPILSVSGEGRVGSISGSGVKREDLCSTGTGRTLLGARGGFLSVIGSEAVDCRATGCLFCSPERRVFSSEQRRFEGDGLEEGSAVQKKGRNF